MGKSKEELFEELRDIVAGNLEVDKEDVVPEARFREDLSADSLDTYEILFAIRKQLDIEIPEEKAAEFEKVQDALDFIYEFVQKKEGGQ